MAHGILARLRQPILPRLVIVTPTDPTDFPTLFVEVSFDSNPGASPGWTDITSYVQGFSVRRGRNHELDRDEAGTCRVDLKNTDRRFDPSYTSGPYYGKLLPMRRLRIRARWNGYVYPIYQGYVDQWPTDWSLHTYTAAAVETTDAFKALSIMRVTGDFVEETTGSRVSSVLTAVDWLGQDLVVNGGTSLTPATSLASVSVLSHLQDIAQAENGRLFVNAAGQVQFIGRRATAAAPYDTSALTFGDGGGSEIPYRALQVSYDDTHIYNEATATRTGDGAVMQTASDTTSQAKYLKRTVDRSSLLVTDDATAYDVAAWLVGQYAEPELRVDQLVIDPRRNPSVMWPALLARELGDRVTVVRRPSVGNSLSQEAFIEAVSHDFEASPRSWATTYRLSPRRAAYSPSPYWYLDDATYSVLDTSTRLTY